MRRSAGPLTSVPVPGGPRHEREPADGEPVTEDELRRAQRHIEEALNELHGLPDPDGVLADARALLAKASVNVRAWRAPVAP